MKPYRFHREADAEFIESLRYYAGVSASLGERFFGEVEQAILDARARPSLFRHIYPPVRRRLLTTFPYAVLYIDEPDCIWIVSVMPLKRDPDYWKRRLDQ